MVFIRMFFFCKTGTKCWFKYHPEVNLGPQKLYVLLLLMRMFRFGCCVLFTNSGGSVDVKYAVFNF